MSQSKSRFACEEGGKVPGLRCGGVLLADLVTIAVPLQQSPHVPLCDTLDGLPLPVEHGGRWRLVVPGGQCFSSVKWVDRLEVTAHEPTTIAARIARACPLRTHES
jgi:hypothetical protein